LQKLRHAVEQSASTIIITDVYGNVEYVNPQFTILTGYQSSEIIGKSMGSLKSKVHNADFYKSMWNTILSGKQWRGEFCNRKKNGDLFWEYATLSPIRDQDGTITNFVAVKEDITTRKNLEERLSMFNSELNRRVQEKTAQLEAEIGHRKEAEEHLKTLLKEKEQVLSEIHKRVNNNLQLMISLLGLESGFLFDIRDSVFFTQSQNRLKVIALIHKHMQQSQAFGKFNATDSLERLVHVLSLSQAFPMDQVRVVSEIKPVFLTTDQAILVGLMVNELISNSFKHGFSDGRDGDIVVEISPGLENTLRICVRDPGPGFPEGFDLGHVRTLGLRIIKTLTMQLKGEITLRQKDPTEVRISLPYESPN